MALTKEMEQYAAERKEDVKKLLRELAVIPAPSHHEELRVEYVKKWMEDNGAEGVYVDDALNVIWPLSDDGKGDLVVFMAHTDVVFPDTAPLPFEEKDGKYFCPGVGDDTARLSILLNAAKYFNDRKMKPGVNILVVANSCEEGLGNLKGSRKIVDTFGDRMKALITVDGGPTGICATAVGSHRYKVTVTTEGGHSYGAFGNRNAIAYLASMIDTLYRMKVPDKEGTKTTYNVGCIQGGTSVNTIAQEASMLYEYRSDDRECLSLMKTMFEKVIEAYRAMGIGVEVELLGERPCNGDVKEPEFTELKERIKSLIKEIYGADARFGSGSTDANYPLSKGIPAVCIGAGKGHGAHTREEWIDVESLHDGLRYILAVLGSYYE